MVCASCGRLSRIRDIQLLHNHIVDRSCFIATSAIESFKQSKYMTTLVIASGTARAAKTDLGSGSKNRMT